MSNEIGVNNYNGSYIQKGIEVKEPRPLSELSIFDLNRIEKALEENLEKGNISQEVFQRELDKLDIVKAGKLSQNGKLKPVHIIDKNGHHRVVWKLPEEISGMKNEGHKKVRQVGKGDKVTYNGETHEVHSISDKHGYWTLIGPDGKKHDKSPARLQAVHAPKDEEESKDKEPKKEETTQNYKVGQKVNIDDFGVNREYTIKKISPNGEMSLEAPGTATFTADKKWLDENKIEPKKEAPKSDANPKEDNSFSEDPIAALKNTPATSGKSGTKEPKKETKSENFELKVGDRIKGNSGNLKYQVGKITSINGDMAQVDFGNGKKYGISLRRIQEGEFKAAEPRKLESLNGKELSKLTNKIIDNPEYQKQIKDLYQGTAALVHQIIPNGEWDQKLGGFNFYIQSDSLTERDIDRVERKLKDRVEIGKAKKSIKQPLGRYTNISVSLKKSFINKFVKDNNIDLYEL